MCVVLSSQVLIVLEENAVQVVKVDKQPFMATTGSMEVRYYD